MIRSSVGITIQSPLAPGADGIGQEEELASKAVPSAQAQDEPNHKDEHQKKPGTPKRASQ